MSTSVTTEAGTSDANFGPIYASMPPAGPDAPEPLFTVCFLLSALRFLFTQQSQDSTTKMTLFIGAGPRNTHNARNRAGPLFLASVG